MLAAATVLAVCLLVSPPGDGPLAGRVVDAHTRAGVAGAIVALDGGAATAVADSEGRFVFPAVAPGVHALTAAVGGFSPSVPFDVSVPDDGRDDVELVYSLHLATDVRGSVEAAAVPVAPLARSILRGRDIASAVGGLDDVGRVLQLRPGIVASQDDRNDLVVRGGGSMETQVVADGFELPTASHFGAAGSASGGISLIPSDVIEGVAVATGGFSSAFGERASSLVEIDLRGADDRRLSGTASLGAGGILGLARGRVGRGGTWLASVRRSILETAFSRGNTRAVPRYRDLFGRLVVPVSTRHDLRLLVLGASDSATVDSVQSTRLSAIQDEQRLALAGLGLRSRWSATTRTAVSVAFSTNQIDAYQASGAVVDGRERTREGELRIRAEGARSVGPAELLAGVTLRRTAVSFDLQDNAYRNEYGNLVQAISASWHDRVFEPAGYMEATIKPAPGVKVAAGVRTERSGVQRGWAASPRLRGEVEVASWGRLTGSWGIHRQAIPFIWVASWQGNGELPPIRCALGTAGIEVRPARRATVSAEAWLKRYSGYPVDPAEPPRVLISAGTDFEVPFVGHLAGVGVVHGAGVDATASWSLGFIDLAASYSHWRLVQKGLDAAWRRSDFDIRHQARVIAAWRPSRGWSASASWRYASGRPYTPFDPVASARAGAGRYDRALTNAALYSPYQRVDVRLERVLTPGRTIVTVFAEVMNLADHDNIYAYTWSRSARRPDPILQWGRTPVAGVRVEF